MNGDLGSLNFSEFHFIRPLWLLVLPAIVLIWWTIRRGATRSARVPAIIAPHLANALTVGDRDRQRLRPIDGVALVLVLLALGTAGPTWSRVPNPLLADTAPVVIALKASKSMMQNDIPPSRLERARHKAQDLIDARAGAKTALIAYAGTSHQVVPLTEDPEVIKPFLEGVDPSVMPRDGEAARLAHAMAEQVLADQDLPGTIVFLLDRITDADRSAFVDRDGDRAVPVIFWVTSNDEGSARTLKDLPYSTVVTVTPDKSDVSRVLNNIDTAYQAALSKDERQKWEDKSWIFTWPAALLTLLWFRKGWTMQWSAVLLAIGLSLSTTQVEAEGWKDWFLTVDQQGYRAFEAKDYQKAADTFNDPTWKAYSLYRLGKYEEAAEAYSWLESSDAAVGEGMSLIKSRSYRPAIAAFEKALTRDPTNEIAEHNLQVARQILEYVETTREQSDTGEEAGIGSDDIVFDNEAGRGADSQQTQSTTETMPETADQWMRTVDTRTGDFLKTRFALEANRGEQ